MPPAISDHAIIGDGQTCAPLADRIDRFLCLPRFDSEACMATMLGDDGTGCWLRDSTFTLTALINTCVRGGDALARLDPARRELTRHPWEPTRRTMRSARRQYRSME